MALREEILIYFKDLNIDVDNKVLQKCIELCETYNINSEDFVDQWFAFTTSNLNGAPPSLEYLELMERKEFKSTKDMMKKTVNTPTRKSMKRPTFFDECTSIYTTFATPKSNQTASKAQTPDRSLVDVSVTNNEDIIGTPSRVYLEKYTQRSDSRNVQCNYGSPLAKYRREKKIENLSVKLCGENSNLDFLYMYEIMGSRAKSINSMTQFLGQAILAKNHLTCTVDAPLRQTGGEIVAYGRIVSDSDGKINSQSVMLETTQELHLGYTVTLNLSQLSSTVSLFPGQIVGIQGTHSVNSNVLVVQKIFAGVPPDLPQEPTVINESMEIVVASGPFTLQGTLTYEPLNDLIKYVIEYQPHILILIGPFMEDTHENIKDNSFPQHLDEFFENIIETVMNQLEKTDTQVIIVSSPRDVYHDPVYPSPAYKIRQNYDKLTFVPDPCLIDINGLIIGATSVDVLLDMSGFEIYQSKNTSSGPDRLGRIAMHLLGQQCFYPLFPPKEGLCLDNELLEIHGIIDPAPHILILPSNLRYFVKEINGSLIVNPERLTKSYVGGSFARIEITPGSSTSICNRTSCQILRI